MRSPRAAFLPTLLLLLCAVVVGPARAQVVVLAGVADFQTPTTVLDFEAFPDLTQVLYSTATLSNQWSALGVMISDDTPVDGASAYSGTYSVMPTSGSRAIADSVNAPGGFLDFTFVDPVTAAPTTVNEVGLWVLNGDSPSTVSFYDASGALLQSFVPAAGATFAGLRAAQGIARVRVTDPDYYLVDDLQFSTLAAVPEPATWITLGAGLAAIAAQRRRRLRSP